MTLIERSLIVPPGIHVFNRVIRIILWNQGHGSIKNLGKTVGPIEEVGDQKTQFVLEKFSKTIFYTSKFLTYK